MSLMDVTRAVLPGMVSRRKGAVINMSSFSAFGGPLLSVYAASKAFVMQWSSASPPDNDIVVCVLGQRFTGCFPNITHPPEVQRRVTPQPAKSVSP